MAVQIKRLSAPKISKDGNAIKFTAQVERGAAMSIVFPSSEINSVIASLIGLITSSKLDEVSAEQGRETYGTRDAGGWRDAPAVVLVKNFQTVDNDNTGGFFLRLEDQGGKTVDISFQPEHVQALKKMIDENSPAAPTAH